MARAKSSDSPRKAKSTAADELAHGIAKLRELNMQIDDLGRDGFPYREAVRARTELAFRETIRRLFGEKSPEYQAHKNHKLRVGSRAESAHSTHLIKQLIAGLENQKAGISGLKSASSPVPTPPVPERPALTAVPPSSPPDSLVAPAAAVALHGAPQTVSAPLSSDLSLTSQAVPPIVMTPPLSMNSAPTGTATVGSSQPVDGASMPYQRVSSSSTLSDTTRSAPAPRALDEKKSFFATPPQEPDTLTSTAQESVGASSYMTEHPQTATAVIQTGASHRPEIPRHAISSIPAATQHSETKAALRIEPPLPLPNVPNTADRSRSGSTSSLSPPPTSAEPLASAVIDTAPQEKMYTAPSTRPIEIVPAERPPASGSMGPEPVPQVELSVAPQVVQEPSNTTTQDNENETDTLELLRRTCARFHLVARQLRLRKEYRATIEITDEYDLQDLFYALLRLQFDEVGTEEWAPDYTNGARRTSYLLDWDRIVVVVKQTKSGISTKDLAEQVKSDAAHYSTRPNGITLVCFIYDPEGRVGNPRGLEADLTSVSDTYMVEVIVAPK